MALIRAQALTGFLFAAFLIVHLVNTMVAALGQKAYDGYLEAMRGAYQLPPVEIIVVGLAGTLHIAIAFRRMLARRRRDRGLRAIDKPAPAQPTWLRIHRTCGWFLVLVIVGHFLATRGPGLFLGKPVDFSYMTFSLTEWPAMMYPYYFLLLFTGVFHLLHGSLVALSVLGWRATPPNTGWTRFAVAVALLIGGAGILSLGGVVGGEIDTSRYPEYREFYETWLPFMATWK